MKLNGTEPDQAIQLITKNWGVVTVEHIVASSAANWTKGIRIGELQVRQVGSLGETNPPEPGTPFVSRQVPWEGRRRWSRSGLGFHIFARPWRRTLHWNYHHSPETAPLPFHRTDRNTTRQPARTENVSQGRESWGVIPWAEERSEQTSEEKEEGEWDRAGVEKTMTGGQRSSPWPYSSPVHWP